LFVDYWKAFDTVCREAFMYKLNHLGIGESFFACLQNMYSNSVTRIKLIQKLSETIDVTIRTEQGHPMSPELLKIYIYDLSTHLAALKDLNKVLLLSKYLGIQFSLNGSYKCAMNELRKKALRAFFSIKRMVDTRVLTTKTMLKLIDCLVKPVATYACQIWLPSTHLMKEMARESSQR
jgi:hypothetical protein